MKLDALTGPLLADRVGDLRTSDVVGLDTMSHVIKTMDDTLPDDPWPTIQVARWLQALIAKGALGQKSGPASSRRRARISMSRLERRTMSWQRREASPALVRSSRREIRPRNCQAARLRPAPGPFLWSCSAPVPTARFILRPSPTPPVTWTWQSAGLRLEPGPFENLAGCWLATGAGWINEDIAAGKAMSTARFRMGPRWQNRRSPGIGDFSPARNAIVPRSANPVYQRQRFPDPVLGESFAPGETVFETDAVRLWHDNDGIAVLSFKTKMNTVSDGVLAGLQQAIDVAERDFQGLVIWQSREPFSAGADLSGAMASLAGGRIERVRGNGRQFPGNQSAHQVRPGSGGRRGARSGAGRRLRVPDARGTQCVLS